MPTIYRIKIDNDTISKDLPEGAAGAVLLDDETKGQLVSYYIALRKNGEWVSIRHPIEDSDLKANGEIWASASKKGILYGLNPMMCLACGEAFHSPEIRYSLPFGCIVPMAVAMLVLLTGFFAFDFKFVQVIATAFGCLMVCALVMHVLGELIGKVKYGKMAQSLRQNACPKCISEKIALVSSLVGKTINLSNGEIAHVSFAGIS